MYLMPVVTLHMNTVCKYLIKSRMNESWIQLQVSCCQNVFCATNPFCLSSHFPPLLHPVLKCDCLSHSASWRSPSPRRCTNSSSMERDVVADMVAGEEAGVDVEVMKRHSHPHFVFFTGLVAESTVKINKKNKKSKSSDVNESNHLKTKAIVFTCLMYRTDADYKFVTFLFSDFCFG